MSKNHMQELGLAAVLLYTLTDISTHALHGFDLKQSGQPQSSKIILPPDAHLNTDHIF